MILSAADDPQTSAELALADLEAEIQFNPEDEDARQA